MRWCALALLLPEPVAGAWGDRLKQGAMEARGWPETKRARAMVQYIGNITNRSGMRRLKDQGWSVSEMYCVA